jgi:uncharacterized protein
MVDKILGRKEEKRRFKRAINDDRSAFIALYGRRRVGKTFLVRQYFDYTFDFQVTGLANANTSQQLANFDNELNKQSHLSFTDPSPNWLVAFHRLTQHIESKINQDKKIIFIDELPWFDTKGTDFMIGLEHFWNGWATMRSDIILIVCGSAASWIINNLINNTGGLHNRITHKMKIEPFTLAETEELLHARGCAFERYQIMQLYIVLGGIPYYLDAIQPQWSAAQNIDYLFFGKSALLRGEFHNLYKSLFKKYDLYEKVIESLHTKKSGLLRQEISEITNIPSGGTLTKVLFDLEESGFIQSYKSYDVKRTKKIYRISDYFTLFHFQFIRNTKFEGEKAWTVNIDHPSIMAWQGLSFEQVCQDHIVQVKRALKIEGIQSSHTTWRGATESKKAQIDIIIDRRDQVINICECKFSINEFEIDAEYAAKLRDKLGVFKAATKTRKSLYMTMISTYGCTKNKWYNSIVQNDITMDDLFVHIEN